METIKVTVPELMEINALIYGVKDVIKGFVHETDPGLKESVKRKVFKVGAETQKQLKDIEEQRQNILKVEDLSDDEKNEKIKDLFATEEELQIDKPAFAAIADASLSGNYQFLYEKIFQD